MTYMQFCPWETATYFSLYSSNVPSLLYYSHLPAIAISLFWGISIFIKARKDRYAESLFGLFLLFSLWAFFDLILWATNRPDVTMFFWSMQVLIEVLVFFLSFHLIYNISNQSDLKINYRIFIWLLLIPFILLIPTSLNLIGVELSSCIAIENIVAKHYSYIIEVIFLVLIVISVMNGYKNNTDKKRKKEIAVTGIGIIFFLMAFTYGNLIGSFLDDWVLAQYGLFGMPVFVTFLVYSIVKFGTFHIKVLGAQALVFALSILVLAILFVQNISDVRLIGFITFILVTIFGFNLIKSVKREVEAREEIQKLAGELKVSNTQLENLVHFISHEIKGALGKTRGTFSEILEGDFGKMPEEMNNLVKSANDDTESAIEMVMNILKSSDLKSGKMKLDMKPFDLKQTIAGILKSLESDIKSKKLEIHQNITDLPSIVLGDQELIGVHVIKNLINNSIKYTPSGSITVNLSKKDDKILFSLKDTGVGLTPEDKSKLFTEGGKGENSTKINVHSTGYGLFFAKGIVESHGGRIWAESDGAGKGSAFFVEFKSA